MGGPVRGGTDIQPLEEISMESINAAQDVAAVWFTVFFLLCLVLPLIGDACKRRR